MKTDRFIHPDSPASVFWTEVYLQNSGSEDACISAGRADEATKAFQARLLEPGTCRLDLSRTPANQRRAPTTDVVREAQAIAADVLAGTPRPELPPGWSIRDDGWLVRVETTGRQEIVTYSNRACMLDYAWTCFMGDHPEWYAFLAAHGMVP